MATGRRGQRLEAHPLGSGPLAWGRSNQGPVPTGSPGKSGMEPGGNLVSWPWPGWHGALARLARLRWDKHWGLWLLRGGS